MKYNKFVFKNHLGELVKNESVLGVAITGSFSRNDNDEYSDIDYVVFANKNVKKIKEGKFFYNTILFDSRIINTLHLEKDTWSRDMYFAYLNCNIIYDKGGIIKKMLNKKRLQWENSRIKEISLTLVNLSVIIKFSDNWKGLYADSHYLKFIKRKDYISAHRVLNLGLELILDLLYLINKTPIPDVKNKSRLLANLAWAPNKTNNFLARSMLVMGKTKADCNRRYNAMNNYLKIIKKYIDKNIILDDDLYKYYLINR